MREVQVSTIPGKKLAVEVKSGTSTFVADEPIDGSGEDLGPSPHEVLLGALGACTAMTLRLYAARKGWEIDSVVVRLTGAREGTEYRIARHVSVVGRIDDAARARLLEIAQKCPVHKTLTGTVAITTDVVVDEVVNPDVGPVS